MSRAVPIILFGWLALVFAFIFSPILFSVIFSFNSDRFPTIPLGSFTTQWYETITENRIGEKIKTKTSASQPNRTIGTARLMRTSASDRPARSLSLQS